MPASAVVGRPWTREEDDRLTQAVAIHGEYTEKWKTIALSVPGRTNKACRKRWLHSLSPNVKKSAWTAEEDQHLLALYAQHPGKWSIIARDILGRTDDACSKRYREALDPMLKKDEWTEDEDRKLLEAYGRIGGKWGTIGQELGRSGLGCRNRWRLLERKRMAKERNTHSDHRLPGTTSTPFSPPPLPSAHAADAHASSSSHAERYSDGTWQGYQSPEHQAFWNVPWADVSMMPPPTDAYTLLAAQSQAVQQQQQHPGASPIHMELGTTGHNHSETSLSHPQGIHNSVGVGLGLERPRDTGATFSFASSSLSSALTEPVATLSAPAPLPTPAAAVVQPSVNFGGMTGHQAQPHAQSSGLPAASVMRTPGEYGSLHSPITQQPLQTFHDHHSMVAGPSSSGHGQTHSIYGGRSSASPHSSTDVDFPSNDHFFMPCDDVEMGDVYDMSSTSTGPSSSRTPSSERDAFHAATVLANYLPTSMQHNAASTQIPLSQHQIPPAQQYTPPRHPTQTSISVERTTPNAHNIEITSRSSPTFSNSSSPSTQPISPQVTRAGDVTAAYLAQLNRRHASRPRIVIETLSDIRASPGIPGLGSGSGAGRGRSQNPPKLSSKLPVADDPNVLAYACGHPTCWPQGVGSSQSRFSTSGELSIHYKMDHAHELSGGEWSGQSLGGNDAPFRCGLEGCGKGWKSVNGLQYHLQISKAHFRRALSVAVNQKESREQAEAIAAAAVASAADLDPNSPAALTSSSAAAKRKVFRCPHNDCPNQYKQMSGLRYHLQHGHPRNSPTQLDVVPPAIARKVGVESTLHSPRTL